MKTIAVHGRFIIPEGSNIQYQENGPVSSTDYFICETCRAMMNNRDRIFKCQEFEFEQICQQCADDCKELGHEVQQVDYFPVMAQGS